MAAGREAVAALGKLLADEELCDPAAMALVAIRDGAAEQLRRRCPNAKGRCRLVIVPQPGGAGRRRSAAAFQQALNDPDREVRIAAGAGLGQAGRRRRRSTAAQGRRRAAGLGTDPGHQALPGAGRETGGGRQEGRGAADLPAPARTRRTPRRSTSARPPKRPWRPCERLFPLRKKCSANRCQ